MYRLPSVALAVTLSLSVAFLGSSALSAQEEKKPSKKSPAEKMDKEGGQKTKDADESKSESKSDADKAPEPTDEKQKKLFEKIHQDVEKKFKKTKKDQVYVYATSEKTKERIEPVDNAPATPPPTGKGRMPKQPGGAPGAKGGVYGGARGSPIGQWETVIKNSVFMTKDRDEAVEKVYKFLVEFPPPTPGAKKKKTKGAEDEPPPPERSLLLVQAFPATKEGEKQAEAKQELLENQFRKEQQSHEWKKQQRKRGG